jgi:signal peptide peptidase SppA
MANPLKMLNNIFRPNPSKAILSDIKSKFSQPLFMHPTYGETSIMSYLETSQFLDGFLDDTFGITYQISDNIAVVDISGGLIARDVVSLSNFGMVSYESIKAEISDLLDDPAIDTIIGRFDSPGGMAAQNMDLSDFIYSSRGQGKKLIAMVDDMAYSAAYGIASAFDEIWVTRTSGVGSVGVVSYHVDQSEYNKKMGVKIEYIYAGDKKVLGNPNEPLTEEGREEYQKEVTRLYNLFTATVARNLGLSVEAVKATEAGTFHGEEAIEIGFAHKVGTFDQLLSSLGWTGDDEEDEMMDNMNSAEVNDAILMNEEGMEISDDVQVPAEGDTDVEAVEAVAEEQPVESGPTEEELAAAALKEQEAAQAKKQAAAIKAMCVSAGVPEAADGYIESGMELSEVRELLLALTSTSDSAIITSASADLREHRNDIQAGWAKAFAKAQKI